MQKMRKMKTREESSCSAEERRWRHASAAFLRSSERYCCQASAGPLRSSIGGREAWRGGGMEGGLVSGEWKGEESVVWLFIKGDT